MYKINSHNLMFFGDYPWTGFNFPLLINDSEKEQRITGVKEHIKAGDYFASLATVLDLTGQMVRKKDVGSSARLSKLKKDLLYLQKNYRIVERDE